jgi:hypothetical protein
MRKLLHLVFALWKTNRPFDEHHFPWASDTSDSQVSPPTPEPADASANDKAVGHKRDMPAQTVVTTAAVSVTPTTTPVNPPAAAARPKVDFAFLRSQLGMEQVLRHLGLGDQLRGRGHQRRCPCPLHAEPTDTKRTFSVHLGKHIAQCFHAACAFHGNVLDLWAAVQRLPLYDAALHLAETFHLPRNREEEPVPGTRPDRRPPDGCPRAVITADGG